MLDFDLVTRGVALLERQISLGEKTQMRENRFSRHNLCSDVSGMPPDPKNAMAILTRASELGLPAAQVKLAEVYASGADGRADLIRAYALTMAAGKDFEPAAKLQDSLEKKMSPEQLSEAQKEFQRLKAKPSTPAEPAKAQ